MLGTPATHAGREGNYSTAHAPQPLWQISATHRNYGLHTHRHTHVCVCVCVGEFLIAFMRPCDAGIMHVLQQGVGVAFKQCLAE